MAVLCLIAVGCAIAAQQTWSSITDPVSAMVAPIQVDLQW